MHISHYLDKNLVTFSKAPDRNTVLQELVAMLDAQGKLEDKNEFYRAILEREKVVSTGIGMGVAIPHAKLSGYQDFFIAIAIHHQGVEWHSLDGAPVHIIFMIGGPDDQQSNYLQILSKLTASIKGQQRYSALLNTSQEEEVIELFSGY